MSAGRPGADRGRPGRAGGAQPNGAADAGLDLPPLTARSVILSVLLGSHPPELPVRSLVRTVGLFGISEGTARVALSRLVADGDVTGNDGRYRLSSRLEARQRRQDEAHRPATRPWRGAWELAVVRPDRRTAAGRDDLEAGLAALLLGELRPGVWTRPANLARRWPDDVLSGVWRFDGRPPAEAAVDDASPPALAARLWDLGGWSRRAAALMDALRATTEPGPRFVVAAAMVRHLQRDPLLPPALLPADWPGDRLRSAYAGYAADLGRLLRDERARHESGA